MKNKRIILFVNSLKTFSWHRRPIADRLLSDNQVTILAPPPRQDENFDELLNKYDVRFLGLSRKGTNPLQEGVSFIKIAQFLRKERPDIIHSFTIKPVIYSSLASFLLPSKTKLVNSITGLGFVFTKRHQRKFLFWTVRALYYVILRFTNAIYIFQKEEDFEELNKIHPVTRYKIIPGSGVDIEKFRPSPLPEENNLLMVSRLIEEKGVLIYLQSLKLLKAAGVNFKAKLIGPVDHDAPNPVTDVQLKRFVDEGLVTYLPFSNSVQDEMRWAKVVCYPTYYNEGIPKVFLETKASARLITNEYVLTEDRIRFECKRLTPEELARRITRLLKDPSLQPVKREAKIIQKSYSAPQIAKRIIDSYFA